MVYALDGERTRLRTFHLPADSPADAEDAGRLLLTMEAVDAELVSVEAVYEP